MNRSWQNYSNSSPGFVYFNTSNPSQSSQNSADTSDFLSLNDSQATTSPQNFQFSPSNYSSPQKFQRNSRKFNQRGKFQNRYSGGNQKNRSFNSNDSFNSSLNNSWQRDSFNNSRRGKSFEYKANISKYLDNSCLKNPWEELERSLQEQRDSKIVDTLQNDDSTLDESHEHESSGIESEGEKIDS